MRRFNWLHLSDWHQGKKDVDRDVAVRALLKDVQNRATISPDLEKIHAIFFTGDLAHAGTAAEYSEAKRILLDPLLETFGDDRPRLYLIPGNHDLDRTEFELLPEGITKPLTTSEEIKKWFGEERRSNELRKPFAAYRKFADQPEIVSFPDWARLDSFDFADRKIGVLGINSAVMCARNYTDTKVDDYGKLAVGEYQFEPLLSQFEACDLSITLMHHPFDWLTPVDRVLVETRLKRASHVILRGHEHLPNVRIESDTDSQVVVIPAGSLYDRRVGSTPQYSNGFNYGSVDLDTGLGTIYLRRWRADNTGWDKERESPPTGEKAFQIPLPNVNPVRTSISSDKPDLAAAERTYLEYVVRANQYLNPAGIAQTQTSVTLPLNEVYVSLDAIRDDSGRIILDPREDDSRSDSPNNESSDDGDSPDEEAVESSRHRIAAAPVRVELPLAVLTSSRMVILGDPGAGKTTLTRFLAGLHAGAILNEKEVVRDDEGNQYGPALFPVRVRAAHYVDRGCTSFSELIEQEVAASGISLSAAKNLVSHRFFVGAVLIIVDGLDEAGDRAARARVVEALTQYLHGQGNLAHIVVTSRISGFAEVQLPGEFDRYTMREMDREQIGRFLTRWCLAVERFHQRQATDAEIRKSAQEQIEKLVSAVDENIGVRRLAANPLLLTILALIQRNGGRLPRRRVELYRQAAQTLLRDWRAAQSGAESMEISETEEDELLVPLAFHMHKEYPSGEIPRSDARSFLIEELKRHRGDGSPGIPDAVDDFLDRIRSHAGVLAERSPGKYAFLHLTFEEYFAAKALVATPIAAVDHIRPLRHQARWEEPIRLGIAMQNAALSTILINAAILGQPVDGYSATADESELEAHLHRDLLIAVRCFGDTVGVSPELRQELISRSLRLVFGENPYIANLAENESSAFAGTSAEHTWLTALVARLEDENWNVRQTAAQALGSLGVKTDAVVLSLVAKLEDEDIDVCQMAAQALGSLGVKTDAVVSALVEKLKDVDLEFCQAAALALGSLGVKTDKVVSALVAKLDDEDFEVRHSAAQALGSLGVKTDKVVSALVAKLEDEDNDVRQSAANALGSLGVRTDAAVTALVTLLQDDNWQVRHSGAQALGSLGVKTDEVVSALVAKLEDEDNDVRQSAANALGSLGVRSDAAVTALVVRLEDRNRQVRQSAANALGSLGVKTDVVATALVAQLEDRNRQARHSAATALMTLGIKTEAVVMVLVESLDDENMENRSSSALSLGAMRVRTDAVITALVKRLKDGDWGVRQSAATALGMLGIRSDEVAFAFLARLHDRNWQVRRSVADTLGILGIRKDAVITALVARRQDRNWQVRRSVAFALGMLGVKNDSVLTALVLQLEDDNSAVCHSATLALYKLVSESPSNG